MSRGVVSSARASSSSRARARSRSCGAFWRGPHHDHVRADQAARVLPRLHARRGGASVRASRFCFDFVFIFFVFFFFSSSLSVPAYLTHRARSRGPPAYPLCCRRDTTGAMATVLQIGTIHSRTELMKLLAIHVQVTERTGGGGGFTASRNRGWGRGFGGESLQSAAQRRGRSRAFECVEPA